MAKTSNAQQGAKKSAWVLTCEYNEYDQQGQVFIAVFSEKPTIGKLASVLAGNDKGTFGNVMQAVALIEHVLAGGGRQCQEYCWYYLEEVPFGDKN